MNGRCHNDPMDFAAEVCDSCGDQFCDNCLVFPRGNRKPPFCTHCAMALSGVRNRRPVKPLPRGEIKKRRKKLKAELAAGDPAARTEPKMPGTDLINSPDLVAALEEPAEPEKGGGLISRLRRRKDDERDDSDAGSDDLPEPVVTVMGGRQSETDGEEDFDAAALVEDLGGSRSDDEDFRPTLPEHASATAILEQLKEHEATGAEDNVWLPPVASPDESPTWTLPEIHQSPLGTSPWESVAASTNPDPSHHDPAPTDDAASTTPEPATLAAPMFVSEAELRSKGPADKDTSGNWVPPTLRGMAPEAQANGDELPRRRRRSE